MSIRAKTRKRLVSLLVAALAVALLAAGGYAGRKWQLNYRARAARVEGLAAAQAGDWPRALERLARCLQRYPNDDEALWQLAQARRQIELPNGAHLAYAAGLLERCLALRPGRPEAQQQLLELYTTLGRTPEALVLADRVLAQKPGDPQALRAKAFALARQRQNEQALAILDGSSPGKGCLELLPEDLDLRLLTLELLQALKRPDTQILARAQAWQQQRPDDPRSDLLQAEAFRLAGERAKGVQLLRRAAGRPAPDPQFTQVLVGMLDASGLYPEALAVLEKATADGRNRRLQQLLIARLWEHNQDSQVVERLAKLDPAAPETPADLLALKALSLHRLNRPEEAKPLIDALTQRAGDPRARAWGLYLREIVEPKLTDPRPIMEKCLAAVAKDPGIAPIHVTLGQAYADVGESDLALQEWQTAHRLRPSWALPLARLARLYGQRDQLDRALAAAAQAAIRAPRSAEVGLTWVLTRGAQVSRHPEAGGIDEVLRAIDEVQAALPGEEQTLGLKAGLLIQTGRKDQAATVIRALLDLPKPPSAAALLRLAETSQVGGLGLEDACYQRCETAHGLTPALASVRALRLAGQDKAVEGRKLLERAKPQSGSGPQTEWRLCWVRYLDATRDPEAVSAVAALAGDLPDHLGAQQLVLGTRAASADRALADRAIERIRALTGEPAVGWRLARARWLLASDQPHRDLPAAVTLLTDLERSVPEVAEVHLLLASAFQRQGNVAAAIEQLTTAITLAPSHASSLGLALAELHASQGDWDRTRKQLEPVLADQTAGPEDRQHAATLLARMGDTDRALALLQPSGSPASAAPESASELLRATLQRDKGQLDDAESAARRLLDQHPSVPAIEFLADLLAARGRTDEARQVLARLDALKPPAEVRALALGRFEQAHGNAEAALRHLRAATQATPPSAEAWRTLIVYLVQTGATKDVQAALGDAARALPGNTGLAALNQQATPLAAFDPKVPPILQPLVISLLDAGVYQPVAIEALHITADAFRTQERTARTLDRLEPLARKAPRFLPLQMLLARMSQSTGRLQEAADLAGRAMQAFPAAAEPPALAAQSLGSLGRWAEALEAARKWRARSAAQPLPADLLLAQAHLRLNQPAECSRVLAPYLAQAVAQPEEYSPVVALIAQSHLAAGQPQKALDFIRPLLPQSARCRVGWMQLASGAPDAKLGETWLTEAGRLVPPTAPGEQLVLAQAWMMLGQRLRNQPFIQRGRALLEQLAQTPEVPPDTLEYLAMLLESEANPSSAEALYRRELKLRPQSPVAQNNLAMILVRRQNDLPKALSLARAAATAAPEVANFQDTLAAVHLALKDYDQAAASLREASRLEPNNPAWLASLADVYVRAGRQDQLTATLAQADRLLAQGAALSDPARRRLDAARAAVPRP